MSDYGLFEAIDDDEGPRARLAAAQHRVASTNKSVEASVQLFNDLSGNALEGVTEPKTAGQVFSSILAMNGKEIIEPLMKIGYSPQESLTLVAKSLGVKEGTWDPPQGLRWEFEPEARYPRTQYLDRKVIVHPADFNDPGGPSTFTGWDKKEQELYPDQGEWTGPQAIQEAEYWAQQPSQKWLGSGGRSSQIRDRDASKKTAGWYEDPDGPPGSLSFDHQSGASVTVHPHAGQWSYSGVTPDGDSWPLQGVYPTAEDAGSAAEGFLSEHSRYASHTAGFPAPTGPRQTQPPRRTNWISDPGTGVDLIGESGDHHLEAYFEDGQWYPSHYHKDRIVDNSPFSNPGSGFEDEYELRDAWDEYVNDITPRFSSRRQGAWDPPRGIRWSDQFGWHGETPNDDDLIVQREPETGYYQFIQPGTAWDGPGTEYSPVNGHGDYHKIDEMYDRDIRNSSRTASPQWGPNFSRPGDELYDWGPARQQATPEPDWNPGYYQNDTPWDPSQDYSEDFLQYLNSQPHQPGISNYPGDAADRDSWGQSDDDYTGSDQQMRDMLGIGNHPKPEFNTVNQQRAGYPLRASKRASKTNGIEPDRR